MSEISRLNSNINTSGLEQNQQSQAILSNTSQVESFVHTLESNSPTAFQERALTDALPANLQATRLAFNFPGSLSKQDNRNAANYVREQRENILAAAERYGIAPEAIAAVLFQEARHYDKDGGFDSKFDNLAKKWVDAPFGSDEAKRAFNSLSQAARDGVAFGIKGKEYNNISYGKAQMQLDNAKRLIREGYVQPPQGWSQNQDRAALKLLLDDDKAPQLIAAWQKLTVDDWTKRGGTNLIKTNTEAQYKLLTQLYSQYTPGESKVNPKPDLRTTQINESGRDAVENFSVIWKALYTNDAFAGFDGKRLPREQRYNPIDDPLARLSGSRLPQNQR